MRSMKAAGSIGANKPLRFRLLVMTPAISAPAWPSAGVPGTKGGMAIGSGPQTTLPPRGRSPQGRGRRTGSDHESTSRQKWALAHGNRCLRLYSHIISFRLNVIGMYFQVSYCAFGRKA